MSSDATDNFWVYEFWAWLQANRNRVLIAVGVVAVVGGGMAISNNQREQQLLAANNALLSLELKKEGKASASDYAGVAGQYQGTSAAERATILSAVALFKEGRYSDAKGKFTAYQSSYPQGAFRGTAMLGIAASDDAANDLAKAETGYQQVITTFPNDAVASQAKLALGLLLEPKDVARAYKLYEEVAKSQGAFRNVGMQRTNQLAEAHPELKSAAAPLPVGIAAPAPSKK